MLNDTWTEIDGCTDSIKHIKWEIAQREEEIKIRRESRRMLGSFRDFVTLKMSQAMERERERQREEEQLREMREQEELAAVAEEERARLEREELARQAEVNKFTNTLNLFKENVKSVSNRLDFESLQPQQLETIDLTIERSVTQKLEKARNEFDAAAEAKKLKSKTLIPSVVIPRIKPYSIPKLRTVREKRSRADRLSTRPVVAKPLSGREKMIDPRSYSSRMTAPTKLKIIAGDKAINSITNEAATKAIENALRISKPETATSVTKDQPSATGQREEAPTSTNRDYKKEGARPKIESREVLPFYGPPENPDPRGYPEDTRSESSSTSRRSRSTGTLADLADKLLPPPSRTPFDILYGFPREILINAQLNEDSIRQWNKVHVSARCRYNWIGETAARTLLSPRTEAGSRFEKRVEDNINHVPSCIRDIEHWVSPVIHIGGIRIKKKFYIVPRCHTEIFAPMRVQLGRNFVHEFVKNVDENRREITLLQGQVREFCRYELRRAANVYDFSKRDRAISHGAHNVR